MTDESILKQIIGRNKNEIISYGYYFHPYYYEQKNINFFPPCKKLYLQAQSLIFILTVLLSFTIFSSPQH